jgi:2-methylcitrate dehydratase PrpD
MSAEFVIALWLKGVAPGPRWVDPRLAADPEVHALMQRVSVEGNPETTTLEYHPWSGPSITDVLKTAPAEVTVCARGTQMTMSSDYAYGDIWGPQEARFTDDALRTKFEEMTRECLAPKQRSALIDLVLDHFADPESLQHLLVMLRETEYRLTGG